MEKEIILTPEGMKKLEEKLNYYKNHLRKEVADRIRQAKEFGEIGENSEYEDAKAEQSFIEGEITNLENLIRNAKIISSKEIHTDVVSLGSTVKLKGIDTKDEVEYTIVGSAESDPSSNKISNECPLGRGIFGRKKGQTVEVIAPAGKFQYQIIKIFKKN